MSANGCTAPVVDADAVIEARTSLIAHGQAERLSDTFKALGDPSRVRLISALSGTQLCVCDLALLLDMSQSAVSHQLRTLRHLRLVRPQRKGRHVYYSLDDDHIEELFRQGLDHVAHQ